MNDINENATDEKTQAPHAPKALWFYVTGVVSYLVCGAICAFIAYDNKMISPTDTPAELAEHTRELKIVLTSSFLGGGLLGAAFGVGGFWILRKGSADTREPEHHDNVS